VAIVQSVSPIDLLRRFAGRMTRRRIVWLSLAVSMSLVGSVLLALEGRPAPRLDGLALSMPVGAEGPAGIESVFRTRADLEGRRWRGIVIHDSGEAFGSPASIARQHEQRGLVGMGHHFLICNGAGAPDGEVHVGFRWLDQLPGAHTAGPEAEVYNQQYIGICLIGDGDRRGFTDAQMRRLIELVAALQRKLDIPVENIRLHRDVAGVSSPGRLFPEAAFRRRLAEVGGLL